MDFESINNFLTLSSTLNYSKAAEDLHITQPTLTKCIHRLESELGQQLFFRNNRGVSLTPEGLTAQKHFKLIMAQSDKLKYELEFPNESHVSHLRVGFLSHSLQRYLPGFLKQYKKNHPYVSVHLIEGDQSSLIDSYISGSLDIFIGTESAMEPLSHCSHTQVNEEPVRIVVPTTSRYAQMDVVDLDEMHDETFILLGNTISYLTPQYSKNNLTMRMCAMHQFHPKTIPCRYFHNIPLMVACDVGVSIITDAAKFYGRGCATFKPIKGHENDVLKIIAYYDNFKKELTEVFALELKEYIAYKNAHPTPETSCC